MIPNQLHVYGQGAWHDDVYIVGDEQALMKLKTVITMALNSGFARDDFFVSDGEGFRVLIKKVVDESINIVPYTQDIAMDHKARWGCEHFTQSELKIGR